MIEWDDNGVGTLNLGDFIESKGELLAAWNEREGFDLIIDCKAIIPSPKDLKEVILHQQEKGNCLVFILPPDQFEQVPPEWITVPTNTEALDFISFEQMQRDLGF